MRDKPPQSAPWDPPRQPREGRWLCWAPISYLGQLQDPLQRPPHIPQLSSAQPLPVLQLVQVLQAPLATLPARLRQPCREHGLVPGWARGPSIPALPPSSSSSPHPQLSTDSIQQIYSKRLQTSFQEQRDISGPGRGPKGQGLSGRGAQRMCCPK